MRRVMVELGWVFVSEIVFQNEDGKDTVFVFHHKTKPLVVALSQTEAAGVLFWSALVVTRSVVQFEEDIVIDGFAFGNVDFRSDKEQCSIAYWQLFERTLSSTTSMEEIAKAVTVGLKDLPVMSGKFDTIDVSFSFLTVGVRWISFVSLT